MASYARSFVTHTLATVHVLSIREVLFVSDFSSNVDRNAHDHLRKSSLSNCSLLGGRFARSCSSHRPSHAQWCNVITIIQQPLLHHQHGSRWTANEQPKDPSRKKSRTIHARCRVKVALRHTYVALRMRSAVQHLYDDWAIHIRRKSMHGRSKLLGV